ncbi:MAG: sulfotransferase domain-containing protein [Phycisphaerae bacterium]|nr:sulfotransferase domain-containing protein [Phycisphaerae bacterium]
MALNKGYIIHSSCYAEQLDPYFEKFNSNNFLLLDFEELKDDTPNVLKKICDFLEIDSGFVFSGLDKIHNKTSGITVTRPL